MFSITSSALNKTLKASMLAALALLSMSPVQAGGTGWVLTQRSKELGDQYVYLNASGVKCVNPRQGVGLVAKSPNFDVYFYNDRTRSYYSLSFDSWRRKLQGRSRTPRNIAWHKAKAGNIIGLKSTRYTATNPQPARGQNAWVEANCWVADQIKVPPRLAELLTTAYGLPTTQLVPLRVTYKRVDGSEETILDTYQQQTTALPDSYLTAPGGYQLAKSEVEVMMTEENKQLVNDIARDLGREPASLGDRSAPTQITPTVVRNNDIPAKGLTLPNGQTISRDEINKFVDMYKQYKQSHGQ
jgi:hypothetical protein